MPSAMSPNGNSMAGFARALRPLASSVSTLQPLVQERRVHPDLRSAPRSGLGGADAGFDGDSCASAFGGAEELDAGAGATRAFARRRQHEDSRGRRWPGQANQDLFESGTRS